MLFIIFPRFIFFRFLFYIFSLIKKFLCFNLNFSLILTNFWYYLSEIRQLKFQQIH